MRTTTKVIVTTAALGLAGAGVLTTASASGGGRGHAGPGRRRPGRRRHHARRVRHRAPGPRLDRQALSGLVQDTRLVGIDFRVQDGKLYGVGDQGGIYVLDVKKSKAYLQEQRPRITLDGSDSYGSTSTRRPTRCGWSPRRAPTCGCRSRRRRPRSWTRRSRVRRPPDAGHRARHRRHRRGVHEQRPGRLDGDDAVRPRHRARPGGDPVARERGHDRAHRARSGSTPPATSASTSAASCAREDRLGRGLRRGRRSPLRRRPADRRLTKQGRIGGSQVTDLAVSLDR